MAGSWGILLAVFIMPLPMLAPLFLLRPSGYPLMWLVFAVGTALTLALSGVIYLFSTPLYRKGSVAARWDTIAFFTFLAAVGIAGIMNADFGGEAGLGSDTGVIHVGPSVFTRKSSDETTSSVHYGDEATQQALKDALDKAGIPYKLETRKGEEFIGWTGKHDAAVQEIQRQVQGPELPPGRTVAFDNPEHQKEFAEWLSKKGVKHEIVKARGKEHVVWESSGDLLRQFILEERPTNCKKTAAAAGAKTRKCP